MNCCCLRFAFAGCPANAKRKQRARTGELAMASISVLRKRVVPLILLGVLGVWPMTATAQFRHVKPDVKPADETVKVGLFVYLTDISRTKGAWQANLYDRWD